MAGIFLQDNQVSFTCMQDLCTDFLCHYRYSKRVIQFVSLCLFIGKTDPNETEVIRGKGRLIVFCIGHHNFSDVRNQDFHCEMA